MLESTFTQPDGMKVTIETVIGGKNNPSIIQRINGFTVVRDTDTRYWCWARQAEDGALESTGYPVHLYDPEELGLEKNIRISNERAKKEEEMIRKELDVIEYGHTINNIRSE